MNSCADRRANPLGWFGPLSAQGNADAGLPDAESVLVGSGEKGHDRETNPPAAVIDYTPLEVFRGHPAGRWRHCCRGHVVKCATGRVAGGAGQRGIFRRARPPTTLNQATGHPPHGFDAAFGAGGGSERLPSGLTARPQFREAPTSGRGIDPDIFRAGGNLIVAGPPTGSSLLSQTVSRGYE